MAFARQTPNEVAHGMWAKVLRDGEEDLVAVEEPLEIRVDGAPLAVTMRTPGHDYPSSSCGVCGKGALGGFARRGKVNVYTGAERVRG